jgi:hypothetical protein
MIYSQRRLIPGSMITPSRARSELGSKRLRRDLNYKRGMESALKFRSGQQMLKARLEEDAEVFEQMAKKSKLKRSAFWLGVADGLIEEANKLK